MRRVITITITMALMFGVNGNSFAWGDKDKCSSYDSCFQAKEYQRAQCYKISSIHNLLELVVKKLGTIDGGSPTLVTPGYSGPAGPASST